MEETLDRFAVMPVVAVIPHNEDPSFEFDEHDDRFWSRVRGWQQKGWHIALHGYNHVYTTKHRGLVPINAKSEFAGVCPQLQRDKLRLGLKVFRSEGIVPKLWVAPGHSFDDATLQALLDETPIRVISDGIALWPYAEKGFTWIPQQRWGLCPSRFGVWTACLHPNTMTLGQIDDVRRFLAEHHAEMVRDLAALVLAFQDRRRSPLERLFQHLYFALLWCRRTKHRLWA